jgi:hypothetical protein
MTNPKDNGASVAPSNCPTFGYTHFIVVFFVHHALLVRIVLTLVAMIFGMSFLNMLNIVVQFVMIYIMVLI